MPQDALKKRGKTIIMAKRDSKTDWRYGRRVKAPGLQSIMGYILPHRTDCEVYLHDTLDITDVMAFLDERNASHPEFKSTIFHALLFSIARMLKERPKMNRYIQGYVMYERDLVSLSFVVKRQFQDNAEEALMVLVPKDTDTITDMSRTIHEFVTKTRKSEHATGGIDEIIDKIAALPRPILSVFLGFIRHIDFWGHNFSVLTDGDPNYSSVLASNLGSIGGPSVYHHLNNYGTNSIMVTLGTIYEDEVRMPDGTKQLRKLVDIGATLDERIADGFYFIRSLKLVKYMFSHPELFETPLSEPSGFDYK